MAGICTDFYDVKDREVRCHGYVEVRENPRFARQRRLPIGIR
jgi:hypothetical protein